MKPIIRQLSSLTRRNRPEGPRTGAERAAAGYALIVVMIAVTVLIIGLLTVLPSTYQESRREREEELIFRGNQYARAVYLFQRQFRRYPSSVNELLHTNNLSFLRKAWPDPMTPAGKWRFIHATPSGAMLDSWTLSQQLGLAPGQNPLAASAQGSLGTSQPGGSFGSSNTASPGSTGPPGQPPSGRPLDASGKPVPAPDCVGGGQSDSTSSSLPTGTLGGAIAGVASCSDAASLRTYNKYGHYSEWEFLGVGFVPVLGVGVAPTVPVTGPLGPGGQFGPSGPPGVALPPTNTPAAGGPGGGAMIPAPPGTPEAPTQPQPSPGGAPQQ